MRTILQFPVNRGERRGLTGIGLLSLCISLLILASGIQGYIFSRAVRHWHKTSGRVVQVNVAADPTWGLDDLLNLVRQPKLDSVVMVKYRYTVSGDDYSDTRQLEDTRSSRDDAQLLARGISIGDSVTVYYNRLNPAESVLYKPPSSASLIQLLIGLGLLVLAIVMMKYQG